ncbi:MAG: trypsin-like peptidase domain-containing protein [Muribaculaceae bacterium]|nr:trypsin-like peptidase domain-containing protein [Muribaculaceae bacterium]
MNRKILTLTLMLLPLLLASCLKEKSPSEIYMDQASGVVLVLNQYYYTATLPDGSVIYFSGLDEDGDMENVAFEADEIEKSMVFGTAFFVDDNGSLLTNRHVVDPYIKKSDVESCVHNLIDALKAYTEYAQGNMAEQYRELEERINDNTTVEWNPYLEEYVVQESSENNDLRRQQQALSQKFDEAEEYLDELRRIDVNQLRLDTHCELGIAYHDTYVTKPDDFKPCVVVRTSKDQEVDLALIRLKDHTTPPNAYVFSPPKSEGTLFGPSVADRENLQLNQQLVLIGYNHGMQLAATREGIKAQLTTGNVSQEPDGQRVMYTIPMLQGSSGSPVVNCYGELVAVNFAGMQGTQGFNFGVPLPRIKEFLARQ